jgi:beta-lactamase regulating signal transducer with metallopeptidase domain
MTATLIQGLNSLATGWVAWVLAAVWQASLLIAGLLVLDQLLGRRIYPQLRLAVWLLVPLKLLVPPAFALALPWSIPLLHRPPAALVAAAMAVTAARPLTTLPAVATTTPGSTMATMAGASAALPHPAISAAGWAMLLWLAGTALGASLLLRSRRRLHRALPQHGTLLEHPAPARGLEQAAAQLGLRRLPLVVIEAGVRTPAVFGLRRPGGPAAARVRAGAVPR